MGVLDIWPSIVLILIIVFLQIPSVARTYRPRQRWGMSVFFLLLAIFMAIPPRSIPTDLVIFPMLLMFIVGVIALWPFTNVLQQLRGVHQRKPE